MEFQHRFNNTHRPTVDTGEGLTEQSHKNETDMNYILRDYTRTGLIRHAQKNQGRYDDVSVQDFHEAMNIVTQSQQMFNELPGQIRARFANNPAEFLSFVQNPANKKEMHDMGILRGNDGIDVRGAATTAPTPPPVGQGVEKPAEPDPTPSSG